MAEPITNSGFKWSKRSLNEMDGINKDLRKVTDLALKYSPYDFIITDGKRTLAEQRKHVANGASKTMKSRHLTGHAVDFVAIVNNKVTWNYTYMKAISDAFKRAAKELGIPIVWGGDWKSFQDTPHIELSKSKYPS